MSAELNLILIGPPGAGKGTQAERITQDFRLAYISTGDEMRKAKDTDEDVRRYVDAGELVPDDVVCKVLMSRLDAEGDDGFVLDGFPRTRPQADVLTDALERQQRQVNRVTFAAELVAAGQRHGRHRVRPAAARARWRPAAPAFRRAGGRP